MANARHPKKYPSGTGLPVTRAWKERVRSALRSNLAAGRSPSSPSELAEAVGAHKTGLLKMLKTEQATYRFVREICDVLDIEPAMIANPAVEPEDAVERSIAALRELPPRKQRRALAILEALIKQLDDE